VLNRELNENEFNDVIDFSDIEIKVDVKISYNFDEINIIKEQIEKSDGFP